MNQAVVGVGSNIEPEKHIAEAKKHLQKEHRFLKESTYLQTKPIGFQDQPDFINGAFLIETELDFDAFATDLKAVETKLGRIRSENKFGPRTIDLDIVVWNGTITDSDYHTRPFLKQSVLELLPNLA